jgi:GGDEF domain-containing protein
MAQRSAAAMTPKGKSRPGDPQNLVDQGFFDFLVDLEVQKAARLQYPISVLCLSVDDPPAIAEQGLRESLAHLAIRELRTTDVAVSLRTVVAAVLLVGAETLNLPGILARLRTAIESAVGSQDSSHITLSVGGGCYPHTATNARELYEQALNLMTRAQTDGGDRAYLPT